MTTYTLYILFASGVLVDNIKTQYRTLHACDVVGANTIAWMMYGPEITLPLVQVQFQRIDGAAWFCAPEYHPPYEEWNG